jgi:hypothetical protein
VEAYEKRRLIAIQKPKLQRKARKKGETRTTDNSR